MSASAAKSWRERSVNVRRSLGEAMVLALASLQLRDALRERGIELVAAIERADVLAPRKSDCMNANVARPKHSPCTPPKISPRPSHDEPSHTEKEDREDHPACEHDLDARRTVAPQREAREHDELIDDDDNERHDRDLRGNHGGRERTGPRERHHHVQREQREPARDGGPRSNCECVKLTEAICAVVMRIASAATS